LLFLPNREAKYFSREDWTRNSQNSPSGKSAGVLDWFVNDEAALPGLRRASHDAEKRFTQHGVDGGDARNARRAWGCGLL
jgi:hypothetical protein